MSVATAPDELVLQGYLHKQAKHLKIWRIRYFKELTYSTKSGRKPRLLLTMGQIQVIDDQNLVYHSGNYVFLLQTRTRKLFLSATTEQERRRWVAELRLLLPEAYDKLHRSISDSSNAGQKLSSAVKTYPIIKKYHKRVSRERRVERKRQQLPKLKRTFTEVWLNEVFTWPSGSTRDEVPLLDALCFAGIPKELRGRAWAWALGNTLQVNEDLFQICKVRAQAVQMEMSLKRDLDHTVVRSLTISSESESAMLESPTRSMSSVSSASSASELDSEDKEVPRSDRHVNDILEGTNNLSIAKSKPTIAVSSTPDISDKSKKRRSSAVLPVQNMLQDAVGIAEMLVAHGERSIKLVNVDMPRTFGHHPLFQPGAEGTKRTTEVLEAYICYRPDLGYVQGMSYLAATLCFHMDSFTAFKALVALMSSSLLFDMFRLEATRTFHYIDVYNKIFEYELPVLAAHFEEIGIDAQMYAVDWALTLFTRSLPLDLALRIWDVYVLLGTPFFFQASMGLLSFFQNSLLAMEPENVMRLLHKFPKNTSSRQLFDSISSVSLSCDEITVLLAGGKLWSPDENREVPVKFPETYE
ncbi:putative Rab-GTPase-TBC domain, pleckstrin domain, PH-like domain superfamily [Plasmopara halstedii]